MHIHHFGDLGDSVIDNRHSTVANGDFGDRVGNSAQGLINGDDVTHLYVHRQWLHFKVATTYYR